MTGFSVSRRAALTGATALGVGAVALGVGAKSGGLPELYRATLERLIGPFSIPPDQFAKFVADFTRERGAPSELEADLLRLSAGLGLTGLILRFNQSGRRRVTAFERNLLAEFTVATGHAAQPASRQLQYQGLFGSAACGNCLARFD